MATRLVDGPADDSHGPAHVADLGEDDHSQVVHRAAPVPGGREELEGGVGGDDGVDAVVVGGGGPQPQHIPVAEHLRLRARHHHQAELGRLAFGRGGEGAPSDPVGVGDPRAEAVGAGQPEPVAVGNGGSVGCELAGHHRNHAPGEHLVSEALGTVGAEEAGAGGAGHERPADGAVGVGDLGEHVQALVDRQLGPAHRPRRQRAVQARLEAGAHQLLGHGGRAGLRGGGSGNIDRRAQLAGPLQQFRSHAAPFQWRRLSLCRTPGSAWEPEVPKPRPIWQ